MSEKDLRSICQDCECFNFCHQIVVEAEEQLVKAFQACGAEEFLFLNIIKKCSNFKERKRKGEG
jgi:hypothetical protein